MIPTPNGPASFTMDGQTVTVAANSYADVPMHRASHMTGFVSLGQVGTTANRPTNAKSGDSYIDTTITKVVMYDGNGNWRDPTSGATA
jgi:hypothetical protein